MQGRNTNGECPSPFGASPWRGPAAWVSRVGLVFGVALVVTCADEEGCSRGGDGEPGYSSYTVETVRYDPATDHVTVFGLYKPVGWVSGCLLPAAAVQHGFQLGEEGFVTFEAATPLGDGFEQRWWAARDAAPFGVELEIPSRGTLRVRHRDKHYPAHTALVIPCSIAVLLAPDGLSNIVMELRCGYCVEHGCGNGVCDPGEDWYDCNLDCAPPVTVCGDGACDGTEMGVCRHDCGCTNDQCNELCVTELGDKDYGFCGATDDSRWNGCSCGWYSTPCDGTEPRCEASDPLGDEVIMCEWTVSARAWRGCNQLCWEAFGTGGGYCDIGLDDCVCEGGLSPW